MNTQYVLGIKKKSISTIAIFWISKMHLLLVNDKDVFIFKNQKKKKFTEKRQ